MAPPKPQWLSFVPQGQVFLWQHGWSVTPVRVLGYRIINGKLMVMVKEAKRHLAGVALVTEEELHEEVR